MLGSVGSLLGFTSVRNIAQGSGHVTEPWLARFSDKGARLAPPPVRKGRATRPGAVGGLHCEPGLGSRRAEEAPAARRGGVWNLSSLVDLEGLNTSLERLFAIPDDLLD
ncbi:hypothetical protein Y1Q_0003791 [Alligator mississippiensis]|uniref:Uncharacterized protein n=1 Tax=Alligator mississippiensis TaxID=8496 RepID=A0A151MNC2_ALLMI|nr:hypothetical protein Y1Q_0003791 [Alligator mississippiensis]